MLEIVRVQPGRLAQGIGLERGDTVISVNERQIRDVIDFKFFTADEHLDVAVKKKSGKVVKIRISKPVDEDLGVELAQLQIKRCRNHCIFCFVDQMPKECRRSLYVKDDDFRASFLYGNYITLGSLTDDDRRRIAEQRLSPLYVSVHSTDPELRAFMLGNKKVPAIMAELKYLVESGVTVHTQIVLCPGINDGPQLEKTIEDLAGLFPAVSSIAAVPVGLTRQRKGLFPLRGFTKREARAVVGLIKPFQKRFKKQFGTRLVFASDEFYIKAGESIPSPSFYEGLPQVENGVGMVADFMREVSRTRLPARLRPQKVSVVTGVSFSRILKNVLKRFESVEGASIRQITVKNRFFGPSVTVAGLLTGADIVHALKGKQLGDMVMIPQNALREDENIFIDDMSLDRLGRDLEVKVVSVSGFRDMVSLLSR